MKQVVNPVFVQVIQRVKHATAQIAHSGAHIAALQLLAIAGYSASLRLALRTPERTL